MDENGYGNSNGNVGTLPYHRLHVFWVAQGLVEACAAVETAAICGDTSPGAAAEVVRLTEKLYAMLTPLARAR